MPVPEGLIRLFPALLTRGGGYLLIRLPHYIYIYLQDLHKLAALRLLQTWAIVQETDSAADIHACLEAILSMGLDSGEQLDPAFVAPKQMLGQRGHL